MSNSKKDKLVGQPNSRRNFLRGCAAMSATPVLSSILQLKMMNSAFAAAAPGDIANANDYRALVCVFLNGGNDSFNMLAPYENAEYNKYRTIRGGLAIPRNNLLQVNDRSGRAFGFHPAMSGVRDLFNSGNMSAIANVGTLVRPTTIQDYNGRIALPRGLFSHNDQQKSWQTSTPDSLTSFGWGGRLADIVNDQTNGRNNLVSMNISLNSVNVFQTGANIVPFAISPGGAIELRRYDEGGVFNSLFTQATDGVLGDTYRNVLKQSMSNTRRGAIDTAIDFQTAVEGIPVRTKFPNSSLGAQLRMVAQTIAARGALGNKRQTFFVSTGGFDSHKELLVSHNELMADLSASLSAFYAATEELGVARNVMSYTASDFGRTLTSNGRGSDHAWGGNHLVMGGAVRGGDVYGDYPTDLVAPRDKAGNSVDVGRGRLLPTTSVDEFYGELARWFGIGNNADLETILPNIRNFYSRQQAGAPLGFIRGGQIG